MTKMIGYVTLPVYENEKNELAGLRQGMLDAGPHRVSSGAGLGSDAVWTELETSEGHEQHEGRRVYRQVLGRDILTAVAELTNHPDADRFPTTTGYKSQQEHHPCPTD